MFAIPYYAVIDTDEDLICYAAMVFAIRHRVDLTLTAVTEQPWSKHNLTA